jgi:O-antigen/teichoic acid export membrane protein
VSLKRNIVANYVSQIYVSAVAIIVLPLYLQQMGAEAYGLVGFYGLLQTWFGLLDMGLSATIGRETARQRGGATSATSLRELLRALESIFVVVAVGGVALLLLASKSLAESWLDFEVLTITEVVTSIQVMAFIVALRWMGGLFRGVLYGNERQVWLSGYNIVFNSLRFIGVLPVLAYGSPSPLWFFRYQLMVAVLELAVVAIKAYTLMPRVDGRTPRFPAFKPLRALLGFSFSISFLSVVWAVVTQTDKLILSKLLSLSEYGQFTLAASAAAGLMTLSSPIASAVQPRMARLHAETNEPGLLELYRGATRMIAVAVFPLAFMLAMFSESALWIWTGDREVSSAISSVFRLYVLGNAVLAVAAFPYYLQFARGDMRLHMYGSLLLLVLLVPSIMVATNSYGMRGAGAAWLGTNLAYLFLWVPFVHKRLAPGLHLPWLISDIGASCITSAAISFAFLALLPLPNSRFPLAMTLITAGAIVVTGTILCRREMRTQVFDAIRRMKPCTTP